MKDIFSLKTSSGRSIGEIVFAPLTAEGICPVVVDVGARNGMFLIPVSYAKQAKLVGFEPNPEEYRKLVAGDTDAMKAGLKMPVFKSLEYHNCALWNATDMRPFYITKGAGACTLMGSAGCQITERMWLDGREESYAELHTEVKETIPIQCRRLDEVMKPEPKIDFLKIDTEGAEMLALEGARGLLERQKILFIKAEFILTPYYKESYVLGHQHSYLHELGFRLIDFDLDHPRYSRNKTIIPELSDRRMIYAGDAYFILDPDRSNLPQLDLHRLSLVCLMFGFHSLAISLMLDAKLLSSGDIKEVEKGLCKVDNIKRLVDLWNRIPYMIYRLLKR